MAERINQIKTRLTAIEDALMAGRLPDADRAGLIGELDALTVEWGRLDPSTAYQDPRPAPQGVLANQPQQGYNDAAPQQGGDGSIRSQLIRLMTKPSR